MSNRTIDLDAFIDLLDGQVDEGDNGTFYLDKSGIRAIVPDVSARQSIGLFSAEKKALRQFERDCRLSFPCTIEDARQWIERTGEADMPDWLTDDECALAEIQENLARNDLTGAERKAFAAEVGRLVAKIAADCQGGDFASGNEGEDGNWLGEMAKATGTPQKTLYNWWKSFCQETDRSITPKQATNDDRSAFFDWLEAAKAKADAEKAAPIDNRGQPRKIPVEVLDYYNAMIDQGAKPLIAHLIAEVIFDADYNPGSLRIASKRWREQQDQE